jgi:hypothetical protein
VKKVAIMRNTILKPALAALALFLAAAGLGAQDSTRDVATRDVPAVPDVNARSPEKIVGAYRDDFTEPEAPYSPEYQAPQAGGSWKSWLFTFGIGATSIIGYAEESSTSAPFGVISPYSEFLIPFEIARQNFAAGVASWGDVAIDMETELPDYDFTMEAALRWHALGQSLWVETRCGPAYVSEGGVNSLRLFLDFDLGTTFMMANGAFEARASLFVTGTGIGLSLSGGLGLAGGTR